MSKNNHSSIKIYLSHWSHELYYLQNSTPISAFLRSIDTKQCFVPLDLTINRNMNTCNNFVGMQKGRENMWLIKDWAGDS